MKQNPNILISGGGTGGHIYPAIAIANQIKQRLPQANILFIGAKDRMEMQKVPSAGYPIKGLNISGINRSKPLKNIQFPIKLFSSIQASKKIVKEFKPDVAIGTGGYASGPMLWVAAKNQIPTLIQEQNSFPGITNKLLAKKVNAICTAYPNIKQFPANKVHLTGNPIRVELFENLPNQQQAKAGFGLNPDLPVVLSLGGSQGSNAINQAWLQCLEQLTQTNIQLIWQTGKLGYQALKNNSDTQHPTIHLTEFINDMQNAYAAADVIVSRAGAMAISELALVGKPSILLPYPFAAEDHQTKNAQALVNKNAAIMIKDTNAKDQLWKNVKHIFSDAELPNQLSVNIKTFAKPNATAHIVDIIFTLMND